MENELSTVERMRLKAIRRGAEHLFFAWYVQGETTGFMAGSTLALTMYAGLRSE